MACTSKSEKQKTKKETNRLRSSKLSVYIVRFSIDYWEHQTYGTVLNGLVFSRGASVGCVKLKPHNGGGKGQKVSRYRIFYKNISTFPFMFWLLKFRIHISKHQFANRSEKKLKLPQVRYALSRLTDWAGLYMNVSQDIYLCNTRCKAYVFVNSNYQYFKLFHSLHLISYKIVLKINIPSIKRSRCLDIRSFITRRYGG